MTFHFFHSAHQNDPIYHSEWAASLKNNRDRGARKNGTVLPHQNRRLQRTCFVNQALSLLFHPFLIVVFHVLFVLPTTAVRLSHRRRIMGEVCVAVITIKFRHVAPQAVGNSVPRRLEVTELMLLNCGVGEDSWESLGLQGDPTSPFWRRSALGFLWKEWC